MTCQHKETKNIHTENEELKSKLVKHQEVIKCKEDKIQELLGDQNCLQEELTKLKTEDQNKVKDLTAKICGKDREIETLMKSKNEFDSQMKTLNEVIDKLRQEAECHIKRIAKETIAKEDAESERNQIRLSLEEVRTEKSQMEKTKDVDIKTLRKILAQLQDEIFGLRQETNQLKEDNQVLVDEKQTLQKACLELHKEQSVEMEILRRSHDKELGELN